MPDGYFHLIKNDRFTLQAKHHRCHPGGARCNSNFAIRYLDSYIWWNINPNASKARYELKLAMIPNGRFTFINNSVSYGPQFSFFFTDGTIMHLSTYFWDAVPVNNWYSNVAVDLGAQYMNRIGGLAGNFNEAWHDDAAFITPNGLNWTVPDRENLFFCRDQNNCPTINPWKGDTAYGTTCPVLDVRYACGVCPPAKNTTLTEWMTKTEYSTVRSTTWTTSTNTGTEWRTITNYVNKTDEIVSTTTKTERTTTFKTEWATTTETRDQWFTETKWTTTTLDQREFLTEYDNITVTTTVTATTTNALALPTGLPAGLDTAYGLANKFCFEAFANLTCGRVTADFYVTACILDATMLGAIPSVINPYIQAFARACADYTNALCRSPITGDQQECQRLSNVFGILPMPKSGPLVVRVNNIQYVQINQQTTINNNYFGGPDCLQCKNGGTLLGTGGCRCTSGWTGLDCSIDCRACIYIPPSQQEIDAVNGRSAKLLNSASGTRVSFVLAVLALLISALM